MKTAIVIPATKALVLAFQGGKSLAEVASAYRIPKPLVERALRRWLAVQDWKVQG